MTELTTSLPYRAATYDNFDKIYANKISEYYNMYISKQMKNNFNKFSNNLMNDEYINRYGLLNAISDFKKTDPYLDSIEDPMWSSFEDNVFNYRPYNM